MKKSKKLLMNRIVVSVFLIILQMIWLAFMLFNVFKMSVALSYLMTIISISAVLYIVNKEDESAYKIIWIILILSVPVFGGLLYICFGNKEPAKKMRLSFEKEMKQIKKVIFHNQVLEQVDDQYIKGQMHYLVSQDFPVYQNNHIEYFALGDDNFPVLIEELKKAKHFIFMEYFIVDDGKMFETILDILKQKVQEGVEVRFMYDDVGSLTMLPRKYYMQLREMGIKSIAFNPFVPFISLVMNNRDHRKITVIDGYVGFCGGFNLADEYINQKMKYGHWKDTGVMIQGEAVWNLTLMFLTTWNVANHSHEDYERYHPRYSQQQVKKGDGFVIPYGDSPLDNEFVGETVYLNIINQAKDYVYIDTPYLILSDTLQNALINAAKRGVDVRIITPGIPDKKIVFRVTRSYYPTLIKNGIRIYEYTPGFIHAKNFVCDDEVATVGTINLDYRSLYLHFECGVYMYQTSCIQDMKKDFFETVKKSHEITKKDIQFGKFRGLFEAVLRLFAPLL